MTIGTGYQHLDLKSHINKSRLAKRISKSNVKKYDSCVIKLKNMHVYSRLGIDHG